MNIGAKKEIYRQYVALLRAREGLGTVNELARKHGVTRQRMHQIVKEVEETLLLTARQREEKNHDQKEEKENTRQTVSTE